MTGQAPSTGWAVWEALDRVAREDAGRVAVREFDAHGNETALSYARLLEEASSIGAALGERARPGDRVVLDGTGGWRQVASLLGAVRAGLWVLPVPMQTTPFGLEELCARSGAVLVLAPEPRVRGVPWMRWRARDGDPPERGAPPGGVMMVTSGTTGARKLALRDAPSLDADARQVIAAARLTPADRVLLAVSLAHSYALDMIAGGLLAGACLETVPVFDLPTVASRLAGGATVFPGVPILFEGLTHRWAGAGDLRLAFSAGSRLAGSTRAAFTHATGVPVGDLYGATELGTVLFRDPLAPPNEPGPEPVPVGTPLPGVSVRVLDRDSGRVLACGEEGELAVRSASMLLGYADGTLELDDGHFRTGDLARLDGHGRVCLTGRLTHLIEAGGVKLNPVELERLIEGHPGVRECLVLPMPASETITRIRALVVPEPGAGAPTPSALRAYLRERVGPARVPRQIELVHELPRSPSGKPMRTLGIGGAV